ncbi:MAG: DoxX family protein [Planctomycetota bacterium]
MDKFLGKFSPQIYALLRITAGFMFTCHGLQKIFGVLGGHQPGIFTQIWFGGVIELVGGLLILIGWRTSYAAFLCSGVMAVAYFQVHQPQGLLPVQNQGELAALYCFVFLFIAARGAGTWSVDARTKKSAAG